jgi:putative ABC transport system permease protein
LKRISPLQNRIQAFCRELETIPGVASASNSTTYLGFNNSTETYQIEGRKASENFLFGTNYVDYDFMNTYEFSLVPGKSRFFDPSRPEDTAAVLINEAAVKEYGIGNPFETVILEPTLGGDTSKLEIIGVMKDFNYSSLYEPIEPYMLRFKLADHEWAGFISIRLGVAGKGLPGTLQRIRETWMEWSNEAPFQYFFLDEELDNNYKEEMRTGRLSMMFAILATFIACLGLFGLTLHNTKRRTREISVRKAMGASTWEVVLYVSREIILLVLISVVLAWIAAYFFMQNWLQDFPFNIGFRPWIYLVAALIALAISLITVFALAYRAATSNPADVLHYE